MKKKLFWAAAACVLAAQPGLADTRDDIMAAMQRCRVIADDRTWLDCAYGAQQPMRARLGLPPAPEFQQRLVPPATAPMPQRFATPAAPAFDPDTRGTRPVAPPPRRRASFLQILTGSAPPITVSTIEATSFDGQGAFTLTLQNGQVWRQSDIDSGFKARPKLGDKVTVTPGALGSYNLKMAASPHVYKVQPRT